MGQTGVTRSAGALRCLCHPRSAQYNWQREKQVLIASTETTRELSLMNWRPVPNPLTNVGPDSNKFHLL